MLAHPNIGAEGGLLLINYHLKSQVSQLDAPDLSWPSPLFI